MQDGGMGQYEKPNHTDKGPKQNDDADNDLANIDYDVELGDVDYDEDAMSRSSSVVSTTSSARRRRRSSSGSSMHSVVEVPIVDELFESTTVLRENARLAEITRAQSGGFVGANGFSDSQPLANDKQLQGLAPQGGDHEALTKVGHSIAEHDGNGDIGGDAQEGEVASESTGNDSRRGGFFMLQSRLAALFVNPYVEMTMAVTSLMYMCLVYVQVSLALPGAIDDLNIWRGFSLASIVLLCVFSTDVILRMFVFGRSYWATLANCIEFAIVMAALALEAVVYVRISRATESDRPGVNAVTIINSLLKLLLFLFRYRRFEYVFSFKYIQEQARLSSAHDGLTASDRLLDLLRSFRHKYPLTTREAQEITWVSFLIASRRLYSSAAVPSTEDHQTEKLFEGLDEDTTNWLLATYSRVQLQQDDNRAALGSPELTPSGSSRLSDLGESESELMPTFSLNDGGEHGDDPEYMTSLPRDEPDSEREAHLHQDSLDAAPALSSAHTAIPPSSPRGPSAVLKDNSSHAGNLNRASHTDTELVLPVLPTVDSAKSVLGAASTRTEGSSEHPEEMKSPLLLPSEAGKNHYPPASDLGRHISGGSVGVQARDLSQFIEALHRETYSPAGTQTRVLGASTAPMRVQDLVGRKFPPAKSYTDLREIGSDMDPNVPLSPVQSRTMAINSRRVVAGDTEELSTFHDRQVSGEMSDSVTSRSANIATQRPEAKSFEDDEGLSPTTPRKRSQLNVCTTMSKFEECDEDDDHNSRVNDHGEGQERPIETLTSRGAQRLDEISPHEHGVVQVDQADDDDDNDSVISTHENIVESTDRAGVASHARNSNDIGEDDLPSPPAPPLVLSDHARDADDITGGGDEDECARGLAESDFTDELMPHQIESPGLRAMPPVLQTLTAHSRSSSTSVPGQRRYSQRKHFTDAVHSSRAAANVTWFDTPNGTGVHHQRTYTTGDGPNNIAQNSFMENPHRDTPAHQMELVDADGVDRLKLLAGELNKLKALRWTQSGIDHINDTMDEWDFDVFEADAFSAGRPLSLVFLGALRKNRIFEQFRGLRYSTIVSMISHVENGYRVTNSYHNRIHAADVVQTTHYFMTHTLLRNAITTQDIFCALVASAIHDFQHPGMNNAFLIATGDKLALRYNDRAVLEHMHVAAAFEMMRTKRCDVLKAVGSTDRYLEARETVIQMVLATDMSHHFDGLEQFKTEVVGYFDRLRQKRRKGHNNTVTGSSLDSMLSGDANMDSEIGTGITSPDTNGGGDDNASHSGDVTDHVAPIEVRRTLLKTTLHCADVSNPAKNPRLCQRWAMLVQEEFFRQGDRERDAGLKISTFMDRRKPAFPKSQIGFITIIVRPLFNSYCQFLSTLKPQVDWCLSANLSHWEQRQADEEQGLVGPGLGGYAHHGMISTTTSPGLGPISPSFGPLNSSSSITGGQHSGTIHGSSGMQQRRKSFRYVSSRIKSSLTRSQSSAVSGDVLQKQQRRLGKNGLKLDLDMLVSPTSPDTQHPSTASTFSPTTPNARPVSSPAHAALKRAATDAALNVGNPRFLS